MTDWRRKYRLTRAMNACVGYKQSRIAFYSSCRCSTLVCIDQVVRAFCSLNHCVSISPSTHGQSFIIDMVLLLGDTAPFISCLSNIGGKRVCFFFCFCACMCAYMVGWMDDCAWDSTICPFFTKKCNKWTSIFQAAGVMKNISDVREDLYFYHASINESNISSHKSTQ